MDNKQDKQIINDSKPILVIQEAEQEIDEVSELVRFCSMLVITTITACFVLSGVKFIMWLF